MRRLNEPAGAGDASRNAKAKLPDLRVVLAFFAIYFLWGTTFLAIRIAVQEMPPLFAAGVRFFVAGVLLYGVTRLRGHSGPTACQWRSLAMIGLLMFVAEYGALFWSEKYGSRWRWAILSRVRLLRFVRSSIRSWIASVFLILRSGKAAI